MDLKGAIKSPERERASLKSFTKATADFYGADENKEDEKCELSFKILPARNFQFFYANWDIMFLFINFINTFLHIFRRYADNRNDISY